MMDFYLRDEDCINSKCRINEHGVFEEIPIIKTQLDYEGHMCRNLGSDYELSRKRLILNDMHHP